MQHSGHDIEQLNDRWHALADRRGWKVSTLLEQEGVPVFAIENSETEGASIYLSAGVHGDECAPIWGLLQWAENASHAELSRPLTIFPCLNPHGVLENTRRDQNGVDLNRSFQEDSVDVIRAWKKFLADRRFDLSLNLHEDYDSTGIYLYELARKESIGHRLLDRCESVIARETSPEVDGREFERGLMSAAFEDVGEILKRDLDGEWPEAIYLCLHHGSHSLTFETPSESDLSTRIAAQRRFIESALELWSQQG